jgi:hypothetical protein
MHIGIFIDGSFLEIVRRACRRDTNTAPSLKEFVAMVRLGVGRAYRVQSDRVDVTEVHWFRGEFIEKQAENRWKGDPRGLENHHIDEQRLNEELTEGHISPHRREMLKVPDRCPEDKWCEKGIDTWLLDEALDFADKWRPEAVVLVGSDGDHITLLERMKKRGIDTVLVYYDSPGQWEPGKTWTRTHWWLKKDGAATKRLKIDWWYGFALLTKSELEQTENAETAKLDRIKRHFQPPSESVPGLRVPTGRSH